MKRAMRLSFAFLFLAGFAFAQIEQGDSEVRFLFFYSKVGGDDSDVSGSLQLSYGKFFTPNLQVGVGPRINISSWAGGETKTKFSGSVYATYNFSTASRTVPYLSAEWYQMDFSPEEGREFTDYAYITIGFGVRNFFTEYAALNSAISYGFSLASEAEGGLLMIMTGLSFIF